MRRVAVIVVRVIVVAVSRMVVVVTMRGAVIGALAKEGHEHQSP